MDPTVTCCPKLACPARGQRGQGHMRLPSRQARRLLCTACHQPCAATKGTACERRRTSVETISLVVTLMAHGCPLQALVIACGVDERTVARWGTRAGVPGQAVPEHLGAHPRALGPVQADASRVKQPGGIVGMALAMMGQTHVWLGGAGSAPRAMPWIRRLLAWVTRGAAPRPLLVGTDGVGASLRAIRETVRAPVHTGQGGRPRLRPWRHILLAHVVKRDERRRGVETARRLVDGTPARVETRRRRSQGAGGIKTVSIERLNATCRARLASLTRRGRALARHTLTLQHGRSLRGAVYPFCTPHASLAPIRGGTTPAMAAGITDHGWTVQALLALPVPPPRWTPPTQRGRPSQALQRLIARWCGDHG